MKIRVIGTALTKDEQLQIFTLLGKAGYKAWFTKGKTADKKSVTYINYEEVRDEQTQEWDKPCGGSPGA